jgi:hypothetical protein
LPKHRRRRRNDDKVDPAPQQQFAQDEAGFVRFAEADIIGDQEIDPRQYERFAQRFELISVEPDAGPERRLKEGRVGRRDAAPSHRAGIRREQLRVIERLLADAAPAGILDDPSVEFVFPQDRNRFALRVVIDSGGMDQRRLA